MSGVAQVVACMVEPGYGQAWAERIGIAAREASAAALGPSAGLPVGCRTEDWACKHSYFAVVGLA